MRRHQEVRPYLSLGVDSAVLEQCLAKDYSLALEFWPIRELPLP